MTTRNIHIQIENHVLKQLVQEQLFAVKSLSMDKEIPADIVIISENDSGDKKGENILCLPKGAIRLGEMLDKLFYIISGRETHIEDDNQVIEINGFILFPANNTIKHMASGDIIYLTDKERLMLRVLSESGEEGISRNQLLQTIWGYVEDTETHTLETHLYRLRQKLAPYNAEDLIIVKDSQYRLNRI